MEQANPLANSATPPQVPINPPINPLVKFSSSNKSILIVLLVVLLVVLSSLATYFIVKSQTKSQAPVSSLTPISSPSFQPSLAPSVVDKTSNWKTYLHYSGKFSFKYPLDWALTDNYPNKGESALVFNEGGKDYQFYVRIAGAGGPLADELRNEDFTISGKKFLKRTWITNNNPFIISFMPNENLGENPFNHLEIYLPPKNTQKYINIFNQILSTFRFD